MTDASPYSPWGGADGPSPALASSGIYLRVDDNVRVTSYNSAAGVILAVRSRMLDLAGGIQASNDAQTPNTDRTAKATIFPSDEGWLLGGEIFATTGAPLEGQCFVVVEIVRGLGASALALQQIAAGYVTAKQPLAFPSLSTLRSTDGRGAIRTISGTTPGAGVEVGETVPAGARWELVSFKASLLTAVAVANRAVSLVITDGASIVGLYPMQSLITASSSVNLTWAPGASGISPLPLVVQEAAIGVGLTLAAGSTLATSTQGFQAADQYSLVRYVVREVLEGA